MVLNTNSGVDGVGSSEYTNSGVLNTNSDTDAIKAFVTHRERYSGQDLFWNGFLVCNSQRALLWPGPGLEWFPRL